MEVLSPCGRRTLFLYISGGRGVKGMLRWWAVLILRRKHGKLSVSCTSRRILILNLYPKGATERAVLSSLAFGFIPSDRLDLIRMSSRIHIPTSVSGAKATCIRPYGPANGVITVVKYNPLMLLAPESLESNLPLRPIGT